MCTRMQKCCNQDRCCTQASKKFWVCLFPRESSPEKLHQSSRQKMKMCTRMQKCCNQDRCCKQASKNWCDSSSRVFSREPSSVKQSKNKNVRSHAKMLQQRQVLQAKLFCDSSSGVFSREPSSVKADKK